jgi:type IV pilus assembly protein PilB
LRAFLRQDPDIIMVGEIRDFETAEIGVKAALTGHLVLSTLHTNDAPSTISRLLNMGIEPFLVTASCNLVLAQRLARKICTECRVETEIDPQVLADVGFSEEQVARGPQFRGTGCRACGDTGYKGRIALYEVMPMKDRLKEMVLQGSSAAEIKQQMIQDGVLTLRMAAINKCMDGVTTVDEVLRCTVSDKN